VFSPDHWVPASLMGWQQGWKSQKTAGVGAGLLGIHAILGGLLFLGVRPALELLAEVSSPSQADQVTLAASLVLVSVFALVRALRFPEFTQVFSMKGNARWKVLRSLSFLGPAEVLVPILLKSGQLGSGYLIPLLAFLAGSWGVGLPLAVWGNRLWNQPWRLPRVLGQAQNRSLALIPSALSILVALLVLTS
jgi:hypothetical protein